MPTPTRDILTWAEQLLDAHAYQDYCPIGLQVAGRAPHVDTVATSVSCTREVFERAEAAGAQLLLVHHGLFWKGMSQVVDATLRDRLDVLFRAGITLAGYHLPLDAHPVIGNNARIADELQLRRLDIPFALHGGRAIGLIGELEAPLATPTFTREVTRVMGGRDPLVFGGETRTDVQRIAICSGGAAADIADAAALGCDAFVTGEPREDSYAFARELGIVMYAAGHHATETFGIRALGDAAARAFTLRHVFLDADNPV
ncbi:MAG: Nif3-like dinuclear metal center hexameric protein [Thermoleophilia bacterium]|nr:Nif3-like dinuclear metal center hexameric protein [Thermoleophilia bacterium]